MKYYFYTSDIPCFHVVHGIDLRRAELGDRSYARLKRNSRPKFFIGSLFIYALLTGACIVLIAFSRMLRLGFDPNQYSHWYQFSLMGFAQIQILLLVIQAFLILLVIYSTFVNSGVLNSWWLKFLILFEIKSADPK